MSVQQAYDDWSSSYDTDVNRTRDLDRQITVELLAGRQFDAILEIGCGTGKNTVFLAEIGKTVHALDFSEGMIAQAKAKVTAGNVRFAMTDLARQWPGEDAAYELVVCNLVLEHIEDLGFVFSEAARVLSDGGQFLVNELHPFRQYEGTKARFQRAAGIEEIPAFIHHISDFLHAAGNSGLRLVKIDERWHAEDGDKPPRIVSFLFEKE